MKTALNLCCTADAAWTALECASWGSSLRAVLSPLATTLQTNTIMAAHS